MHAPTSRTYFAQLAAAADLTHAMAEVRCLERILPAAEIVYRIVDEIRREPRFKAQVGAAWNHLFGAAAALLDVCETDAFHLMLDACAEAPLQARTGIIRDAVSIASSLALNDEEAGEEHPGIRAWTAETLWTAEMIDPVAFAKAVGAVYARRHPAERDTEAWISYAAAVGSKMPKRRLLRQEEAFVPLCPPGHTEPSIVDPEPPEAACDAVEEMVRRMEAEPLPYEHARTMAGRLREALNEAVAAVAGSKLPDPEVLA